MISPPHNDPIKNPQQPVIIADPATGKYWKTGCFYALWHFGRAKPGSAVVYTSDKSDIYPTISKTAFYDDESKQYTVVLMNDDRSDHDITLEIEAEVIVVNLPAVSLTTLVIQA
eukprot:GSChrysophyteH1.ASY1.ANO1.1081.1 assembled CDS